jgi:hypothetical protein
MPQGDHGSGNEGEVDDHAHAGSVVAEVVRA